MKLKISALDCLVISQILPEKGSLLTMMIRDEIISKCKISENIKKAIIKKDSKIDEIDIKTASSTKIDVDLVESQVRFLKNQVERLDKEEKINPTIFKLCLIIQDAKIE